MRRTESRRRGGRSEDAGGAARLEKPIILVGAARSGTSLLGDLLRRHPAVDYWLEPRPVWSYGHAYRRDDRLTEADATPRLTRYIQRRFREHLRASGAARFAEKTPSNCLRIPFVHAVFPDCRVVHIIRDGRETVPSAMLRARSAPRRPPILTRLRETSPLEWPANLPLLFRTVWRTQILRKSAWYWGPRPPGWRQWKDLPAHVRFAKQWAALVETALRDGRALPPECYMELFYEELLREPEKHVTRILDFADLPRAEEVLSYTREYVDPDRSRPARQLVDDAMRPDIEAEMEPLLRELGYLDGK